MKIFNPNSILCLFFLIFPALGVFYNVEKVIVQRKGTIIRAEIVRMFEGGSKTSPSCRFTDKGELFSDNVTNNFLETHEVGDTIEFLHYDDIPGTFVRPNRSPTYFYWDIGICVILIGFAGAGFIHFGVAEARQNQTYYRQLRQQQKDKKRKKKNR